MDGLFELIMVGGLLLVGWLAGSTAERNHLRSLKSREAALAHMLVTDLRSFPGLAGGGKTPTLIVGEVVIATDYLKTFLTGLKKLVGGELRSYLSLVERARREALLRVLEEAHRQGYNAVGNIRLDSADVGGVAKGRGAAMVTLIASGTAYHAAP